MKKILFAACLLTILLGCSSTQKPAPLAGVPKLDVDRFMGQWYVIASIPSKIYDGQAYNATETYERAERGIRITYSFNRKAFDGKERSFTARAMITDPGLNTNWEVTYVTWPLQRNYRVLHVEDDYSCVVIGQPSRKTAWILGRQKTISDALDSDIILVLQDRGYHVGKIRKVPHQ